MSRAERIQALQAEARSLADQSTVCIIQRSLQLAEDARALADMPVPAGVKQLAFVLAMQASTAANSMRAINERR